MPAHLTGTRIGTALDKTVGDAGLGLGPLGEDKAGRGANMVYADGPVPLFDREEGTYVVAEHRLPDPAWRRPVVPREGMAFEYHYFDSSYLPLYRQRAHTAGRRDGCESPAYPYGDPCGPRKPPRQGTPAVAAVVDNTAVAPAERARQQLARLGGPTSGRPVPVPAPGDDRDRR